MTSLWLQQSAPLPAGALPQRSDAVVIGGGIAGVATALHLARAGVSVALLERQSVASRASGRNDGQLLLGLGEHYNRIVGQFGPARAPELWDFLQQNHDALLAEIREQQIECGLRHAGGLRLAETEHEWRELQQAHALLVAEGKRCERIDPDALPERLPAGRGFHGALSLPDEAIVQPAQMVRGLAQAAARAGAHVVEGAEVTAITGEAGAFTVALADGRAVATSVVVHCTSALARQLDPSGVLQRAVFPFRGQILATDALPDDIAAQFPDCAMSSNFCYEYFRMHEGRFVLGGMRWSVRGEQLGIVDDDGHDPEISDNLIAYAHRHFPVLRDVPFPHVWTGIMAGTPDGLPLCGALPGQPGVFALLGFNGYGLSFAFLAGRCVAEMIVGGGGDEHAALSMFAPRRLQPA